MATENKIIKIEEEKKKMTKIEPPVKIHTVGNIRKNKENFDTN